MGSVPRSADAGAGVGVAPRSGAPRGRLAGDRTLRERGPMMSAVHGRHPLVLTLVLAGIQLLAVLDGLAASLALPHIGAELHLGPAGQAWVLNATSVALAGGLLVSGRLG